MTTAEFSDSFSTLLNSYNSQAQFGEQASGREIVLDEYEKSVLLTQAQDIIVKSYFDSHTNQIGQGFDDSSRRQVDFSSLIKVATLDTVVSHNTFDDRGVIFKFPVVQAEDGKEYSRVLYILNESLVGNKSSFRAEFIVGEGTSAEGCQIISFVNNSNLPIQITVVASTSSTTTAAYTEATSDSPAKLRLTVGDKASIQNVTDALYNALEDTPFGGYIAYTIKGVPTITKETQQSALLNRAGVVEGEAKYVIVPINYKEYDRMMSKAYAQPLKKQAWRIFQNISTGYDIYSEVIPIWKINPADLVYKIRYVERPTPIVLTDLPDGLSIDGYSKEKDCILNPILHPDILQKAVELAIATRGGRQVEAAPQRKNS
jgi:hypothetical protein